MPTLAEKKTTFPSISSLIGRAFSILRQKMDVSNLSEIDIKVFIPAPTFCLKSKKVYSINGKRKNISLVRKNEKKI